MHHILEITLEAIHVVHGVTNTDTYMALMTMMQYETSIIYACLPC